MVCLDALFPNEAVSLGDRPSGLILTGWTDGILHRWIRSSTGRWIGVVTIRIRTAPPVHGQHEGERFLAKDQLVPAEAMRPAPPPR